MDRADDMKRINQDGVDDGWRRKPLKLRLYQTERRRTVDGAMGKTVAVSTDNSLSLDTLPLPLLSRYYTPPNFHNTF